MQESLECVKCHTENPPDALYCKNCGARLPPREEAREWGGTSGELLATSGGGCLGWIGAAALVVGVPILALITLVLVFVLISPFCMHP